MKSIKSLKFIDVNLKNDDRSNDKIKLDYICGSSHCVVFVTVFA